MKLMNTSKKGQTMVEYSLIVALISVAAIAVLVILGPRIAAIFQTADDALATGEAAAAAAR